MTYKWYIEYYYQQRKIRHAIIKAKDKDTAEEKFYKKHPYTLIKHTSMI